MSLNEAKEVYEGARNKYLEELENECQRIKEGGRGKGEGGRGKQDPYFYRKDQGVVGSTGETVLLSELKKLMPITTHANNLVEKNPGKFSRWELGNLLCKTYPHRSIKYIGQFISNAICGNGNLTFQWSEKSGKLYP